MIFLHTSDWHLGATEGEYDLLEDQYYFVDEICRIISERKVDAVLLAGDVYDRSVASAAAIRLYDYAMNRICREPRQRGAPVQLWTAAGKGGTVHLRRGGAGAESHLF